MSDAVVALRSLPRRFREVVSGPIGDDAWDTLVRKVDQSGRSALGWTIHTTQLVATLGTVVLELPLTARPLVDLAKVNRSRIEAPRSTTTEQVTAELAEAAERAATAVAGRSHEDFDREILVDGGEVEAREFVNRIVLASVAHLREADAAIQAARDH